MIPLKGVGGIRNLCLPERCDICGKKMKHTVLCGSTCTKCFVWFEWYWCYLVAKYVRFSIRKYLYNEVPKPRSIPDGYEGELKC